MSIAQRALRDVRGGLGVARRVAQLVELGVRTSQIAIESTARDLLRLGPSGRQMDARVAAEVARSFGEMKGVAMKLGQLLSFVDDAVPEPMRDALSTLQTTAPQLERRAVESALRAGLPVRPESAFREFDWDAVGAASIGQVHRAVLRDGRAVAVKVQYPGAAEAIRSDLVNVQAAAAVARMVWPGLDVGAITRELRDKLTEELDYLSEAESQERFHRLFRGHPAVVVPAVHHALTSSSVLVTDFVDGRDFGQVRSAGEAERNRYGEVIFRFVFRSLYRFRVFNGDPHPGNYVFLDDGRVAFIDFGMVKAFEEQTVKQLEGIVRSGVLEPDPARFRAAHEEAGFVARGAPISDEQLWDFMAPFWEIVAHDGPFTMTSEHASSLVHQFFSGSRESELARSFSVPPDFLLLQRINVGLMAVLGRLQATANWRAIAEELFPFTDGPPATDLGRAEAAWLADRASAL